MTRTVFNALIFASVCTGCTMLDEQLVIGEDLVVITMGPDRPRVRVAAFVDECKWRAKWHLGRDYEVRLECSVPTDALRVRMD